MMNDESVTQLLREANDFLVTGSPDAEGLAMFARKLLEESTFPKGQLVCLPVVAQIAKRLYAADSPEKCREIRKKLHEQTDGWAIWMLGQPTAEVAQVKALAKLLKDFDEHALARRLLKRAAKEDPLNVKIGQLLSLCSYKDEELPVDTRFDEALRILERIGLRDPNCCDPETLGQGGAIYKRRWERNGQIEDLQASLYFYRKGWASNPTDDMGYCGVNAAYVLDVLAFRERTTAVRAGIAVQSADEVEQQSQKLRLEMRRELPIIARAKAERARNDRRPEDDPQRQYWYLATMAEVTFGLGDWAASTSWLAQARQAGHDEWELQSTAKQLVAIARMRNLLPPAENVPIEQWPDPWRALHALLGDHARAALNCHRGKVGLALSGGGFRASLYHLGVLARFAECDVLRSVEVLSTVSGGSIIGAHYYLALRNLLKTKLDGDLTREDYVELVDDVSRLFLDGVQENLRVRALANLWCNIKMLLGRSYGRSNRMGELYEKFLFERVNDKHPKGKMRCMAELLIHPLIKEASNGGEAEHDTTFKPKFSNWRRAAKIPILLINSTSLNSGHNWHFTASWMGEPPGLMGQEVDVNERYRRLYYHQAPTEEFKQFPLGYAVAASAGVPALFDPITLRGLYPGRTVRLVDGGVHDNQGVAGLLDEDCSLILCSDASGQMDDQDSPASNTLSVFIRSDSIFQDRMREAQYQDLAAREASHSLQGLFFIHLKQELDTDPIDWINCNDPSQPNCRSSCTSYGVDRKLQNLLSAMRTDLDTFSESEALSLMASGYVMADHQLRELDQNYQKEGVNGHWGGFDISAPRQSRWLFSPLIPILASDPDGSDRRATDLEKQLAVSGKLFFKVWLLVPWLRYTAIAIVLGILVWSVIWMNDHWKTKIVLENEFGVNSIVVAALLIVLGLVLPFAAAFQPIALLRKWLFMIGVASFGYVAACIHLLIFDPIFKSRGALTRLLRLPCK